MVKVPTSKLTPPVFGVAGSFKFLKYVPPFEKHIEKESVELAEGNILISSDKFSFNNSIPPLPELKFVSEHYKSLA